MDFRQHIASQISFAPGLLKHYRDANGFDFSDLEARGPFKLSRTDPCVPCLIEYGNSSINLAGNASNCQNCSTNPSGLSLPAAAMARGKTGAFTAEQWVELHQQLLIFKCIAEGVSIQPAMVMALRSSVSGLSRACRGLAAYNAWTSNLGNQTSMAVDPEPNRCRRTDGKKWRCAKDVMPDQKYCEKHMNRGRNRARKSMQPSSNTAPPSSSPTSMLPAPNPSYETSTLCKPTMTTAPPAALNIFIPQQPIKNLSPSFASFPANNLQAPAAAAAVANRHFPARNLGLNPQLLPTPFKQNVASMLNYGSSYQPKPLISSGVSGNSYPTRSPFSAGVTTDSNVQPFWQFFDLEDDKISRGISKKGLSMFTPRQIDCVAASSTGSPQTVKMESACLKLSMESDGMDLSMGSELSEDVGQHQKWVPISWEANVGGPLGEVLQSSTPHNIGLNLLGEGWDGSPQASSGAASPTDVLHKPIFGSYSDSSSSASSPSRSIKPACSSAVLN